MLQNPIRNLGIVSVLLTVILLAGCATDYPNQNQLNKRMPSITGESLSKQKISFPEDVAGRQVVLLLGYVQNAQFDIDRWLIGLDMTQTSVDVYELPTIQGMLPRFFKTQIDSGMRKGIPKELWKGVVTIYKDGEKLQRFTGNINPNNARVMLLNEQGDVKYFYDRGFSVMALNKLRNEITKTPIQ